MTKAATKPRKAGRDRPAEIEITEEMIEAGTDAITSVSLLDDPFAEIVATIYRAMEKARSGRPKAS